MSAGVSGRSAGAAAVTCVLRIAFVSPGLVRGGGETAMLALARALRASGRYRCFVYAVYGGGALLQEAARVSERTVIVLPLDGLRARLRRWRCRGRRGSPHSPAPWASGPRRLLSELRTTAEDVLALPALVAYLRADRIQLVHAHQASLGLLAALAGRLAGCPVVLTVHGQSRERMGPLERGKLWLAGRLLAHVTAVSESARASFLQAAPMPAGRTSTVYNGIAGEPGRRRGRAEAHTFGVAGNLTPIKGHRVLLRATRLVADAQPAARLIVMGDGPERASLESLAESLGLGPQVEFAGPYAGCDDPRFREFLQRIQLLVIPSFSEGCPMVALEAMAAGLPIVASKVGGLPELIAEGVTGRLVLAGDPQALAQAILALLRDPSACREMGRRAHEQFERRFTVQAMATQFERLYLSLWRAKGGGPR